MQIIGGLHKGRKLKSPGDGLVRPTLAKIREAFFDIVGQDVMDCDFLDMYAGTGAIGIEALSRGARRACFVERSRTVATLLSKNLAFMESNLYVIMMMDVKRAMEKMEKEHIQFNMAYVDPPYKDTGAYSSLLPDMIDRKLMRGPWVIGIEHDGQIKDILQGVHSDMTIKTYRYGDTSLTVVRGQ